MAFLIQFFYLVLTNQIPYCEKIMQWKSLLNSLTTWRSASGKPFFLFGFVSLFLGLLGKTRADSYANSSLKGGVVFTARQELGQLWPLDQLVHLHLVVRHQELDLACDHLKQAEKRLKPRIPREHWVDLLRTRKQLCHETHKRYKRGAMQYIWHAIGSFLGLENSPHQSNIGAENWHVLELNEEQLQKQLKQLYNQTRDHLEQVQSNLHRQTVDQLRLDHAEKLSELRTIRMKLKQDVQLLRGGWLPEKWKDTLIALVDQRFSSNPALKVRLEKHLRSWKEGKLPISTFWLPNDRLEAVIHLPESKASHSRKLQKLTNIKILPLANNLPIIKEGRVKIWQIRSNSVFSHQANTEITMTEDRLQRDCLQISNEFFCPSLEISTPPRSCESSVMEGNISKIIDWCDLAEVWMDHFAWNHDQNWTLVCADTQPMAKVCPHSSNSIWCQPKIQVFELKAKCHIKTPHFTLMGPPDGKSQVLQLEPYFHLTQESNFSEANLTAWEFSTSPLKHILVDRKIEQQSQETRWWLWVLTFLIVGALILICAILFGIGYCSFDNQRSS